MKTLFFCNLYPRKQGAFEQMLGALGAEFRRRGDRLVLALAGEPIAPVAAAWQEEGIRWCIVKGWNTPDDHVRPWRFCLPAVRLLRREQPDVAVVHFGNELPALAVSVAWRMAGGGPRWVWQQDQRIQDPSRVATHASRIRMLTWGFDRFVAVYEGGRRSLLLRGVPNARVAVIHNSAPEYVPVRSAGWLRKELGLPEDSVAALTVASLLPRKRVDFLLRVFADVPAQLPPHLVVAGDGPEGDALRRLAHERGIARQVHFLGLRQDVREIMPECDFLVHAAEAEACSYAIIESMATGIPAVVTDAGAAREQIEDGVTGFVLEPHDLQGFTKRVAALAVDASLRQRLGAAAHERWDKRYRTEVAARRYHELYRSLTRDA